MTDEQLQEALEPIVDAGPNGLPIPNGTTPGQRVLMDRGFAYQPVNVWKLFNAADRMVATSRGRTWLTQRKAPPPAPPAPQPTPDPDPPAPDPVQEPPAPEPDPEPDPDPTPPNVPDIPPAGLPDGGRSDTPPVETGAGSPPEAVPVTDGVGDSLGGGPVGEAEPGEAAAHAELMTGVRAAVAGAMDMRMLAAALKPLHAKAVQAGIVGGSGRQVLPLTRRNATKWSQEPTRYALQGVDEP